MTNPLPSSAKAAADVQRYDCGGPVVPATSGPYVRHSDYLSLLAKLTEVEKERDAARLMVDEESKRGIGALMELGRVRQERDTALSRLAQSDALLREAREEIEPTIRFRKDENGEMRAVPGWVPLAYRIDSHLATATTKEGKK